MKIFGHPWIESEPFYTIRSIDDIKSTPPNSTLKIENFDIEMLHYCNKNSLTYLVVVSNIKEAIFANILNAKYLIGSKKMVKELMPIAQNYLFDTQVLAFIQNDDEIEEMAKANVDGVLIT